MKFTYNIQKVDFFIDQIEEMGQVNTKQAIEIFQSFPFDNQLKEARNRTLTSCLPSVSFKSNDNKTLGIWAENKKGFFVHYSNDKQIADFFISNDSFLNPMGYTVEEFIELFFEEKIEPVLNLSDKPIDELETKYNKQTINSNNITFSFCGKQKIKYYLSTIPWLVFSLFLLIIDLIGNLELIWGLHLLFSFFWLPGTIVHLTYWLKNRNAIVTIDIKEKILTYEKNGQRIKFKREDIHYCAINETRSITAPWNDYSYIYFVLKEKKQVVITNLITEPKNIVNSLKPNFRVNRRTIPFLPI